MNKSILIIIVLLLIIGVGYYLYNVGQSPANDQGPVSEPGEGGDSQENEPEQTERIEFSTINKGADSGGDITEPISEVVHSQERWEEVWSSAAEGQVPSPELPVVDFENETVVVVYQGQKPSGGYEIEITDVVRNQDGTVTVSVEETEPGSTCGTIDIITEPFHFIKLPKIDSDTKVEFNRTVTVINC